MVRCAIYTRKSHEEGLEQDFNSLDAQRAACAAYIASQKHEGWIALPTGYDDGGVSGATLARPALRRLLADIENGRVDVIVVYKVDRLTRALSDFARMVEVFDRKAVSFVSVTQQFNTTTSMGRLTLNVLLSFAQFEREVTGERIRDKIAASKKRGLWMGGNPPLGYDVEDRKLIVNETEAETVRHIFRQYREIKSVRELRRRLQAQGVTSKRRVVRDGRVTGDKPLNRGALYHLLHNRIYRGEIVHRERSYPGDHEAIVDQALWDEAQTILATNTHGERREGTRQPSLLTGPCRRRTWRGPRHHCARASRRRTSSIRRTQESGSAPVASPTGRTERRRCAGRPWPLWRRRSTTDASPGTSISGCSRHTWIATTTTLQRCRRSDNLSSPLPLTFYYRWDTLQWESRRRCPSPVFGDASKNSGTPGVSQRTSRSNWRGLLRDAAVPRLASDRIGQHGKDVFEERGHGQVRPVRTAACELESRLPSRTPLYLERSR